MTEIEFLLYQINARVRKIQELADENKADKARIKEIEQANQSKKP